MTMAIDRQVGLAHQNPDARMARSVDLCRLLLSRAWWGRCDDEPLLTSAVSLILLLQSPSLLFHHSSPPRSTASYAVNMTGHRYNSGKRTRAYLTLYGPVDSSNDDVEKLSLVDLYKLPLEGLLL